MIFQAIRRSRLDDLMRDVCMVQFDVYSMKSKTIIIITSLKLLLEGRTKLCYCCTSQAYIILF